MKIIRHHFYVNFADNGKQSEVAVQLAEQSRLRCLCSLVAPMRHGMARKEAYPQLSLPAGLPIIDAYLKRCGNNPAQFSNSAIDEALRLLCPS